MVGSDASDYSSRRVAQSAKSDSMCSCQSDRPTQMDLQWASIRSAAENCHRDLDPDSVGCKTCCLLSVVRTVHAVRSSHSRNWADAVNHASSAMLNIFSNSSGTPSTFTGGAPARGIIFSIG